MRFHSVTCKPDHVRAQAASRLALRWHTQPHLTSTTKAHHDASFPCKNYQPPRESHSAGILTGALFGLNPDASAGVLIQQRSFDLFGAGYPLTGEGTTVAGENNVLNYHRWDPSMGTLTGARWVLDSWLIGAGIGHLNSTSTDPNQTVEGSVEMRLRAGAPHLVGTGSPAWDIQLDHTFGFDCFTSLAAGQCDMHLDFSEAVKGEVNATDLSAFEGVGDFVQGVELAGWMINTAHSPFVDISSIGAFHLFGGLGDSSGAHLSLIYEFDAPGASVPEPTSALLAGLGLALVAGTRRRSGTSEGAKLPEA